MKAAGELFEQTKFPITTWYFIGDAPGEPDTGSEVVTPPVIDTQKPITGGDSSGNSNDASGNLPSYSCPHHNLKTYTVGEITYELQCGNGHSMGHWTSEPGTNLKACADRCAAIPECNSCDFDRTTNICYFKKAPSVTAPWVNGDAWYRVTCPKVRATEANKKPEITKNLVCPQSTDCGSPFTI
ncbi:PAN domain containing protein [Ilyonectria robusta]